MIKYLKSKKLQFQDAQNDSVSQIFPKLEF